MVPRFVAKSITLSFLLALCISRGAGIFLGFSYEAREKSSVQWPPIDADRFPGSNVQLKLLLLKQLAFMDYVFITGSSIDHLVDRHHAQGIMEFASVIVRSSEDSPPPLILETLHSVQSALKASGLDKKIRISAMFSLPTLENLAKNSEEDLQSIIKLIRHSQSFLTIEVLSDLTSVDDSIRHVIQASIRTSYLLPNLNIPVVLILKSFAPEPNDINEFKLLEKVSSFLEIDPKFKDRILGIYIHAASFHSLSRRELLGDENKLIKVAIHDAYPTNPATMPITVPSTIPTPIPTIITVPATNPATVLPTNPSVNPFTYPITVPSTHPFPTPITNPANPANFPITVPATKPMPDPVTNPANPVDMPITNPIFPPPLMPVTNPVTTPATNPVNQPFTNPVTTYPYSQPSMTPPFSSPAMNPGTFPASPVGLGQTWCVAKPGLPDSTFQTALDYACGMGGADCSGIQDTGSCYNPNTLQAHASYAFNSYFQRNPVPSSCDFGGTAFIVTVNPSTATCVFPSSSSAAGYNPAAGLNPATGLNPASGFIPPTYGINPAASGFNPATNGAGSGSASGSGSGSSGSAALNNNSYGGSSSGADYGSNNPSSSSRRSISLLICGFLQVFVLAFTVSLVGLEYGYFLWLYYDADIAGL